MGLISKTLMRIKRGYSVIDGVLVKYTGNDSVVVTIDDDVKAICRNAFDGKDVKINYCDAQIGRRLTNSIYGSIEYDEGTCMAAVGFSSVQISEAINSAIAKKQKENPEVEWKFTEIDIDDVNAINQKIENIKRSNLIKIDGDSVESFMGLPFVSNPQFDDNYEKIQNAMGYGVLFVKNLNKDNYQNLPHNFIYNLIKSHSFCKAPLSKNWLIVLEVGEKVILDAPGGVSTFNANWCKNIPVERFLKDMEREGKLVDVEEIQESKIETENSSTENDKPAVAETLSETAEKTVDWEERHFQICLALLSRTDIGIRGATNDPKMPMIIKQADKMVELLKEHYSEL